MKRRLLVTLSWLLGTLSLLAELGIFGVLRYTNRLYASDGPWLIAEYAEPFRSASLALLAIVTGALTVRAARAGSGRAALGMLVTLMVGCALSCELGMGIFFHPISGELSVREGIASRFEVRLPINETGPCFTSDTRGFFRWSVGGRAFTPRLLPLPLEATELKKGLLCPWLAK